MWLRGQSELDAAIEIDHRFGLAERVSSAYILSAADRDTPMGQALVEDAVRAIARVDVAPGFRLSLSRAALLPLVPAVVAFLLSVFLNPVSGQYPTPGEFRTKTKSKRPPRSRIRKSPSD